MTGWFLNLRAVTIVVLGMFSLTLAFGVVPAGANVVDPIDPTVVENEESVDPQETETTEVDVDAPVIGEAPDELPLSEDEGSKAFWNNVRRFVIVIAFVSVMFVLWSKIEKNRAAEQGQQR